jgi:hypothetical protein
MRRGILKRSLPVKARHHRSDLHSVKKPRGSFAVLAAQIAHEFSLK